VCNMADSSGPTTTTDVTEKQIELGKFDDQKISAKCLQRTSAYAEDPLAYLNKVLGPDVVESRRNLLSIPEILPLHNDGYGSGAHKDRFEQHIADLFGKSHGLFFMTGVQAQSVACKIHCTRSNNLLVAWHATAHLEDAEQSGVTTLFGLRRVLLGNDSNSLPTVAEIESMAKLPEGERPAMILLEIPNASLGCDAFAFSELTQISRICKDAGIKMHCDGARIWEIEPYYRLTHEKSFRDIAALFDSVYVSFYKGLGGSSGAMLLSNDADFMLSARIWQRRAGGNPYTSMYELIDCERGFNENIGTFDKKWLKMKEIVYGISQATKKYQKDGEPVVSFRRSVPTCCIAFIYLHGYTTDELNAARDRVLQNTGVKVFNSVRRMWEKKSFDDVLIDKWEKGLKISNENTGENTKEHLESSAGERSLHKTAYMIYSPEMLNLGLTTYVEAWVNLCEELARETNAQ
jgi:Beta-eliminating lyase